MLVSYYVSTNLSQLKKLESYWLNLSGCNGKLPLQKLCIYKVVDSKIIMTIYYHYCILLKKALKCDLAS